MSRVNLTKPIKNACWEYNIGREFQGECNTGCGSIINVFNYECGHITSVADGGGNTLDNLKPICSTCNKSMGSKNMIEFIIESGYTPKFLDSKTKKEKLYLGNSITLPVNIKINSNFRIGNCINLKDNKLIYSYTYLLKDELPIEFREIKSEILCTENDIIIETDLGRIDYEDLELDDYKRIDINIEILEYLIKSNNKTQQDLMFILNEMEFKLPNIEMYKLVDKSKIIKTNKYKEEYDLIIDDELFKLFAKKFKKSHKNVNPLDYIRNYMIINKLNITQEGLSIST